MFPILKIGKPMVHVKLIYTFAYLNRRLNDI
jgi:hypothetical protein